MTSRRSRRRSTRPGTGEILGLADGADTGPGNRDLDFRGKDLVLRSQTGDPAACRLDAQRRGRCVNFQSQEGPGAVRAGVTLRGGQADSGGAVICTGASSPVVSNCIFSGNEAELMGGAVLCTAGAAPSFASCVFTDNRAGNSGGDVLCRDARVVFSYCTFLANNTGDSGTISLDHAEGTFFNCTVVLNEGDALSCASSSLEFERTIIAFNAGGRAVLMGDCAPILDGCDLYGDPAATGSTAWSPSSGTTATSPWIRSSVIPKTGG